MCVAKATPFSVWGNMKICMILLWLKIYKKIKHTYAYHPPLPKEIRLGQGRWPLNEHFCIQLINGVWLLLIFGDYFKKNVQMLNQGLELKNNTWYKHHNFYFDCLHNLYDWIYSVRWRISKVGRYLWFVVQILRNTGLSFAFAFKYLLHSMCSKVIGAVLT